jgi:hypothetical protein
MVTTMIHNNLTVYPLFILAWYFFNGNFKARKLRFGTRVFILNLLFDDCDLIPA